MDVTKPYEFTEFEAMDVTKTYQFIGLGELRGGGLLGTSETLRPAFSTLCLARFHLRAWLMHWALMQVPLRSGQGP